MVGEQPHLCWKRYWCPRTGSLPLFDDGYLIEPTPETTRFFRLDVVAFDTLAPVPCLALLGEPGIGKSTALTDEFTALESAVTGSQDAVLIKDLKSYGSEDRLLRAIFEDPTFTAWSTGTHTLYLLLDSLDECLLRITTVADLLLEEFAKYRASISRLRLRIACRTAEWPHHLETGLRNLWGKDAVNAYELAPLTRENVRGAAQAYNVDDTRFFAEVDRVQAVPLAIKPVTLHFLLGVFRRTSQLPATQNELYLDGCRLLCEETSHSRRGAGLRGELSSDQRLAVARRIAAITILCNRAAVFTGIGDSPTPDSDLPVRELVGGMEKANDNMFSVGESEVREVLATSLFSSRGPERLGWAHQTYAAYLAGTYMLENMSAKQASNLFLCSAEGHRYVVPQLHEAAAWLAGMSPAIMAEIMREDPHVLLRSDVASATDETRATLVTSLLQLFDADELLDKAELRGTYRKLKHSGLPEQLRSYITDKNKGMVIRRFAIDVAEACGLAALNDVLLEVTLDPADDPYIRTQAAYAIEAIGDAQYKARLLPLAEDPSGDDPDDQLKGCGLRAVWPGAMPTQRMFELITPPKNPNFHGAYAGFLYQVAENLTTADLSSALVWVERQEYKHNSLGPLGHLAHEIIAKAWDEENHPELWQVLARVILKRLALHADIIRPESRTKKRPLWTDSDPKRRRLLAVAVTLLDEAKLEPIGLVYGSTRVVVPDDIPWMVEQIRVEQDAAIRNVWGELIQRAFYQQFDHLDTLLAAMDVEEITARLSGNFAPVELNSPAAEQARANLAKHKEMCQPRPEPPLLEPSPQEQIEYHLNRCESGHPDEWWMLNQEMTLEPRSTHYEDLYEMDLTKLPGWQASPPETRSRIIATAKTYLAAGRPNADKWLGKNIFHYPAAAGFRALILLSKEDPAFIGSLKTSIWDKWAPIIVAYPTGSSSDKEEPRQALVRLAYEKVPDGIIEVLLKLIDADNAKVDNLFSLRKAALCWDERMVRVLTPKVRDPALKPSCMGELLEELLRHGGTEAKDYAMSLLTVPLPADDTDRAKAHQAALSLLWHTDDAGWSALWPAMQSDEAWGKEVLLAVSHRPDQHLKGLQAKLPECCLAELYKWAMRHFPPSEDPEDRNAGMHFVGPRESVARLRDSILEKLKERGTSAALAEIRRLIRDLPDATHLKWALLSASTIMLQRTWVPPKPQHVLDLARTSQSYLVESGEQLMEVVIDSLRRWEAELQGAPPAAFLLWDKLPSETWRPFDEDRFSDAVALHLRRDLEYRGIVVNREVVIRRGEKPGGKGERTDVHVDAIRRGPQPDTYDVITLVIETKGCWNKELNSAMSEQLVGRYLNDTPCRHGIYLVGWFVCPQWSDDTDSRRNHTPSCSLDALQTELHQQATKLSSGKRQVCAVVINAALR
jgi:predicted NACHT family NTPase